MTFFEPRKLESYPTSEPTDPIFFMNTLTSEKSHSPVEFDKVMSRDPIACFALNARRSAYSGEIVLPSTLSFVSNALVAAVARWKSSRKALAYRVISISRVEGAFEDDEPLWNHHPIASGNTGSTQESYHHRKECDTELLDSA